MPKWINDLSETTPVVDAARRVLALRLEAVRDCLADALRDAEDRTRHIHALRVATRRASAALDVFRRCLPRKVSKAARQHVRALRRAVGAARDWDVLMRQLAGGIATADEADRPAFDMLMGYALAQRIPAQRLLEKACPDYPFGFDRLQARTLAAVRHRGTGGTLGDQARPLLARLVATLDAACDGDDRDWVHLHEIRLAGKRLRYALELFRGCFGQAHERLAPVLAGLQEVLGDVNDRYNAATLLRHILDGLGDCLPDGAERYRRLIERQIDEHSAAMVAGRDAYRRWLEQWRSADVRQSLATIHPSLTVRPASEARAVPLGRTA